MQLVMQGDSYAGPKQVQRLVLSGAPQGMGQVRVLDFGRLGRTGHHLTTV
jgi:hypothetical protein